MSDKDDSKERSAENFSSVPGRVASGNSTVFSGLEAFIKKDPALKKIKSLKVIGELLTAATATMEANYYRERGDTFNAIGAIGGGVGSITGSLLGGTLGGAIGTPLGAMAGSYIGSEVLGYVGKRTAQFFYDPARTTNEVLEDVNHVVTSFSDTVSSTVDEYITPVIDTVNEYAISPILENPVSKAIGSAAQSIYENTVSGFQNIISWFKDDPEEDKQNAPNNKIQKKQGPGWYDPHGTKLYERHGKSKKEAIDDYYENQFPNQRLYSAESPIIGKGKSPTSLLPRNSFIDNIQDDKLSADIDDLLKEAKKSNLPSPSSQELRSKSKYRLNPNDREPSSTKAKPALPKFPTLAIPKTISTIDQTIKPSSSKDSDPTPSDKSFLQTVLPDGSLSDSVLVDNCRDAICDRNEKFGTCDDRPYICIRKSFSQNSEQGEENEPQAPNANQTYAPPTYAPPSSPAPGSAPGETSLLRPGNIAPAFNTDFSAAAGMGINININQSISVGAGADVQQVQTAMNEANSKAQNDWESIVADLFRDQRRVEYGATSGVA